MLPALHLGSMAMLLLVSPPSTPLLSLKRLPVALSGFPCRASHAATKRSRVAQCWWVRVFRHPFPRGRRFHTRIRSTGDCSFASILSSVSFSLKRGKGWCKWHFAPPSSHGPQPARVRRSEAMSGEMQRQGTASPGASACGAQRGPTLSSVRFAVQMRIYFGSLTRAQVGALSTVPAKQSFHRRGAGSSPGARLFHVRRRGPRARASACPRTLTSRRLPSDCFSHSHSPLHATLRATPLRAHTALHAT